MDEENAKKRRVGNTVSPSKNFLPSNCTKINDFSITVDAYGEKGVRKTMEDESLICLSLHHVYQNIPITFDFSIFGIFDGHGGRQSVSFVKENLVYEIYSQILLLSDITFNSSFSFSKNACVSVDMADTQQKCADDGPKTPDNSKEKDEPFIDYFSLPYEYTIPDRIIKRIMTKAFAKLDARIAAEITGCKDGCTAVVLLMKNHDVYVCSLGDSAAFLGRNKDSLMHAIPLVECHKPWVVKEKERILKCGGTIENGRINGVLEITRSFGDISFKKFGVLCIPTFRKFYLDATLDEFIILGCDGFWGNWTATDAISKTHEFCLKEFRRMSVESDLVFNLRQICKSLVEYVLVEKKSQDNVSVLIIKILKN